ncbi:MAG TPA: hypothetical protein EYN66_12175 [Myxococcales bacterium]|nr:hypothetical protein [Myxococcales bacterium]
MLRWMLVGSLLIFSYSCSSPKSGASQASGASGFSTGGGNTDGVFSPTTGGEGTATNSDAPDASMGGNGSGGESGSDIQKPDNDSIVGIGDKPTGACGYGDIYGLICSKAEQKFVNNADVWVESVDCDGNPITVETSSDGGGYYTLKGVPSGTQTVHVKRNNFERTYDVVVLPGQLTDVSGVGHKECFKAVDDCPVGNITGYVCAPNATLLIGGATVYVETTNCNGKAVKIGAVSDDLGNYELENVPVGQVTVMIEKGSFKTQYQVLVPSGGTIHSPDVVQDACFSKDKTKIAVVTGDWDKIEAILSKLGFEYDLYDGLSNIQETIGLLTDLNKMSSYDIIFFNCGGSHDDILLTNTNAITNNLQKFVAAGGSIYASDWAFVYAEWPWPNSIGFVGGNQNIYGPKLGMMGPVTGTVTDPVLANFLGKNTVNLNYDLGMWVVVENAAANTKIHIQGNVNMLGQSISNAPLMLSHTPGGKVLYTTFHNEPQMTQDMEKILNFLVFEL